MHELINILINRWYQQLGFIDTGQCWGDGVENQIQWDELGPIFGFSPFFSQFSPSSQERITGMDPGGSGMDPGQGLLSQFLLLLVKELWESRDAMKNWKTTPQLSRGERGDIPEKRQNSQEKSTLPTSRARLPPGFSSTGDFPALTQHLEGFEELLSKRIPRPERHKINITSARAGAAHLHIPGLIIARQLRCFDNNQGLNMLNMLNSLNICPPVARNRRAGLQIFAPRLFDISEKVKNGRTNSGISEPFNNLDFIEYSPSPLRHFSLAN